LHFVWCEHIWWDYDLIECNSIVSNKDLIYCSFGVTESDRLQTNAKDLIKNLVVNYLFDANYTFGKHFSIHWIHYFLLISSNIFPLYEVMFLIISKFFYFMARIHRQTLIELKINGFCHKIRPDFMTVLLIRITVCDRSLSQFFELLRLLLFVINKLILINKSKNIDFWLYLPELWAKRLH